MSVTPQPGAPGVDLQATDADETEDAAPEKRSSVVDPALHGMRLDRGLVAVAPEFSRSHLKTLIDGGHVRLDGIVQRLPARRLRVGQVLDVELVPTAQSLAFRPEPMPLRIVYEDAELLVIDKPAGMVVHPAAGNWSGTLLNGLLAHHAGASMLPRAGIVHRLDKDTTGLMVVAKTLQSMTSLVRAIGLREVSRVYLALAVGEVPWPEARIEAPIGRDPVSRLKMAVLASGKPARTDVVRLAVAEGTTSLRCRLHTGRTHQIRVHLADRGFPLVGDVLYGGRPMRGMRRQALHAAELAFAHPRDARALCFRSPLPEDLAEAWIGG